MAHQYMPKIFHESRKNTPLQLLNRPPPRPSHPPTYLMYGPLEHGPKINKSASALLKLYFHLCLKG